MPLPSMCEDLCLKRTARWKSETLERSWKSLIRGGIWLSTCSLSHYIVDRHLLFNILFYPLILPSCMKLRTFQDCYFITWSLLRSTCNMTYLLELSLALNYLRAPHFVRQQPTEPSDFHLATWVHFRHFGTAQSDLSDLSWCVVVLMLSSELKFRNLYRMAQRF